MASFLKNRDYNFIINVVIVECGYKISFSLPNLCNYFANCWLIGHTFLLAFLKLQRLTVCFFYYHVRQSIDLYSSVPSPSIGFLGTPSLSRLGSSFLSSSITRRHTPEVLSSLIKPLLPSDEQQHDQQRRSSHSLLPPIPSRRHSVKKILPDHRYKVSSHEAPVSRQSSYGQAVLNGMIRALCFIAYLSIFHKRRHLVVHDS